MREDEEKLAVVQDSPNLSAEEVLGAVNLAEFALRQGTGGDFPRAAICRLCALGKSVKDPLLHCKLRVILWTLDRLPYAPPVLVGKSLENLRAVSESLGNRGKD